MTFHRAYLLWLLVAALPALGLFFWWSARARQRLIAQFVHARLLAHLTVGASRKRQILRAALLTASIGLLIVTLAQPRWGFTFEEARQKGLDIIVAVDTSRSMMAADIAPNRLARAKLAAMDLKKLARTDRVGLIAFAGTAFLQCPLSYDDEAFRQNIDTLDVNIIPQGGSALGEAIETARRAFEEKVGNFNVLVIFSDGEDNEGSAVQAAKAAAQDGMRIFTVGVGTPNGELLPVTDNKGRSDYVRDDAGNVVKSRLNEQLLRDIAGAAGGFFMLLAGATTIDMLYERGLAPLPQSEQSAGKIKRFHERYQWFLGLAIILLLTEMFLPERQKKAPVAIAPSLARAALIAFLCFCAGGALASPSTAMKKYRVGNFDSAQAEFERLLKEKPDDSRLRFNAGAAAFQGGDYESASKYFNSALLTPDIGLQQQAYYNLGNAQYRTGENAEEPALKKEEWEASVKSYESALTLNNSDGDARHNLEFVKKQLEELKKQEQQKKENQDKQDEKKDDEKQDDQKKEDQQKQDQKDDKGDQKKDEQKKPEEDKKDGKENQENKTDPQKPDDKQKQDQPPPGEQPKEAPSAEGGRAIPMTPQEAQRLLDTLRSEERAMIFLPATRTNRSERILKDW